MYFRSTLLTAAALAICAAVPDLPGIRLPFPPRLTMEAFDAPSVSEVFVGVTGHDEKRSTHLGDEGKLAIIRYVDGEYAKALQPLPHEKEGFKVAVGKPLNMKELQYQLRHEGTIANPGDTVQITAIEFRGKEIAVQINGGGKRKFHLREHLQVGVGNLPPPSMADHPNEGRGTTIILDYGRPVPNLSPDDLKHDLSALLDFSKHSAAVNWFDSLPPNIQQAIREHRALVGMDEEMVIAALGRADHKVRERNTQGEDTETWIYGTPPAKTVFVIFIHEKVSRVEVFNDPGAKSATNTN
ncbi:MAG TPA: hypothetical protein VKS44_14740 [Candidatus Acidoferrales bacterium]|nr:hypothetical protein [Candidatus Acidoferrales bacterium]